MTNEEAIEVLKSHKKHWCRLLRDNICTKQEGEDFLNAVDMAISALRNESEEEE